MAQYFCFAIQVGIKWVRYSTKSTHTKSLLEKTSPEANVYCTHIKRPSTKCSLSQKSPLTKYRPPDKTSPHPSRKNFSRTKYPLVKCVQAQMVPIHDGEPSHVRCRVKGRSCQSQGDVYQMSSSL